MKTFLLTMFILNPFFVLYAQSPGTIIGGDGTRNRELRDFQDQRQSLIDSFMDSREDRVNIDLDVSGPGFDGGDGAGDVDFEGGTHIGTNNQRLIDNEGTPIRIHSLQQALGRGSNDPAGVAAALAQERKAPMRLYFDQIHFESDEVSEVTLKDGTVVTTQELQEFAKEVILKKLNEQK